MMRYLDSLGLMGILGFSGYPRVDVAGLKAIPFVDLGARSPKYWGWGPLGIL